MNIDTINKFMLSIFFIYLLLLTSSMESLLNCEIKKTINKSKYAKHFIIFATIYVLTFILNWYTPESIVVNEDKKANVKEGFEEYISTEAFASFPSFQKYKYLLESFFYSFVIYTIFLFTTKMDIQYLLWFMGLMIFVFIIFLLYKVNLSELNLETLENNNYYLTKESLVKNIQNVNESIEIKDDEINNIVILYNTLILSYLLIPVLCGKGLYDYYLKYGKNMNIIEFLLKDNDC